jgi:hypothetical protein
MRRQRPCRVHLLLIVPLTLLVFSERLTWTQERPSASKTPTQLSSLATRFPAVPEAGIRFNPTCEKLSLPFASNQGQTPSLLKFRTLDLGYHLSLTKNNAPPDLWQLAKIEQTQVNANYFISNAPAEWLADAVAHNTVNFRTPDPGGDLAYYGHSIPWAGRIVLGIGQQAKLHPRVVRVFELIKPGLSPGKPSNPRWLGR